VSAAAHVSAAALLPIPPADTPATAAGLTLISQPVRFHDETGLHGAGPQLSLAGGILVDMDSGAVLWARNPDVAHAPASTTKALSSMVALENFAPGMVVTITPDALHQDPDETVMGLKAGQRLTVQELLTGMLTVSANDAATALAADTVGLPRFVTAMNAQVRALGLQDSSFTTPVGLDDPGQLASPHDLAAIADVDYTHFDIFRRLVALHDGDLPATADHPAFRLHNLNQLLDTYPAAVGIKPGYTAAAGGCLIGLAVRGGHRLLSVILGGNRVYSESRTLFDWGFAQEGAAPPAPPAPAARAVAVRVAR
jgi:D-alanyl-D-alanine carboxypeptidase (penicillin-binding protein 5/6)